MSARVARISALVLALTLAPVVVGAARAVAQGLPDLIVDQATLRQHWVTRHENLPAEFCSVQEGDITPGEHLLLRFTVGTPNIGEADLFVGDPNQHVAEGDGLFELATCHQHYHFRHYALYQLIDPASGQVWRTAKRGFCMIDIEKYGEYPGPNNNPYNYRNCGAVGIPGNQGISKGWSDVYHWKLAGQYFVLDGGDGQPLVPPGDYLLRITVNPGYTPGPGEVCRFADPLHPGVCHQLQESNYENNVAEVMVTVPDHRGRQAVGPLKNEPAVNSEIFE